MDTNTLPPTLVAFCAVLVQDYMPIGEAEAILERAALLAESAPNLASPALLFGAGLAARLMEPEGDTLGHDRPSVGEREDEQDGTSEFEQLGIASSYSLTIGGGSDT